jgi:hypothetical protein
VLERDGEVVLPSFKKNRMVAVRIAPPSTPPKMSKIDDLCFTLGQAPSPSAVIAGS